MYSGNRIDPDALEKILNEEQQKGNEFNEFGEHMESAADTIKDILIKEGLPKEGALDTARTVMIFAAMALLTAPRGGN